jgi:hypothetical protein
MENARKDRNKRKNAKEDRVNDLFAQFNEQIDCLAKQMFAEQIFKKGDPIHEIERRLDQRLQELDNMTIDLHKICK